MLLASPKTIIGSPVVLFIAGQSTTKWPKLGPVVELRLNTGPKLTIPVRRTVELAFQLAGITAPASLSSQYVEPELKKIYSEPAATPGIGIRVFELKRI